MITIPSHSFLLPGTFQRYYSLLRIMMQGVPLLQIFLSLPVYSLSPLHEVGEYGFQDAAGWLSP